MLSHPIESSHIQLNCTGETGRLRTVIIGTPTNFPTNPLAIAAINNRSIETRALDVLPPQALVAQEFELLVSALRNEEVTVLQPVLLPHAVEQLYTRDLGIVIDQTFVRASMAKEERSMEFEGIAPLLDSECEFLELPTSVTLEGGDVILDKGTLIVGLSERTTLDGANYLSQHFPHYKLLTVPIRPPTKSFEVLHLDCAYLPIGNDAALVYADAFYDSPRNIFGDKDFIVVTAEEQYELATNVLSIDSTHVLSRAKFTRVNDEIQKRGITVTALPFNSAILLGGSFRCCSLPLFRDA